MGATRILIAGVGNIFLGDDAFGVEVAQRMKDRPLPDGVKVVDFGIRGIDLAYCLLDGYDKVILVDTVQRGGPPGSLYVIDPVVEHLAEDESPMIQAHNLEPSRVLTLLQTMGQTIPFIRLVGCEPATFEPNDGGDLQLSVTVRGAFDEAVNIIESLINQWLPAQEPEAV